MQRSRDASWRTSPLHGRIPADAVHCDLAENPGIRVAQVTAGTRCYTIPRSRGSPRSPGLYTSGTNTLRVGDGGFDLAAVAHDAGVAEQPLDVALAESRDARGIESAERAAERLALAQDGDPREPGLEGVERELLVERAVVARRNAPLLVVVALVERISFGPGAALSRRFGHGRKISLPSLNGEGAAWSGCRRSRPGTTSTSSSVRRRRLSLASSSSSRR